MESRLLNFFYEKKKKPTLSTPSPTPACFKVYYFIVYLFRNIFFNLLRRDGPRLRQSGDGVLGHRRRNRECEGAQTFVAAAEPGSTVSAPPRSDRAQERPRETKRLFGHREIPQAEEHGPDLRGGHGAPTRAQEIPNVVAVVVSRFSTVRTNGGKLLFFIRVCVFSFSPAQRDGRWAHHRRAGAWKSWVRI